MQPVALRLEPEGLTDAAAWVMALGSFLSSRRMRVRVLCVLAHVRVYMYPCGDPRLMLGITFLFTEAGALDQITSSQIRLRAAVASPFYGWGHRPASAPTRYGSGLRSAHMVCGKRSNH